MSQLKSFTNFSINATQPASRVNAEQLRMERRRFPRRIIEAKVTAVFTSEDGRMGVMPLELTDTSITGMGARCTMEIAAGTKIMICPTNVPVPSRSCTVVHCHAGEGGEGFELGLRFENKRAA